MQRREAIIAALIVREQVHDQISSAAAGTPGVRISVSLGDEGSLPKKLSITEF
jgi:hypothetical protein